MRTKKLFLDLDEEDENINLGLLRLSHDIKPHELFYKINSLNEFQFSNIKDLVVTRQYYRYKFLRFEAYHHLSKNCIQIIANKSFESQQLKPQKELFSVESANGLFFNDLLEVDYIIKSSDLIDDFSLILLPENSVFQLQTISLCSQDERYQLIQYYE